MEGALDASVLVEEIDTSQGNHTGVGVEAIGTFEQASHLDGFSTVHQQLLPRKTIEPAHRACVAFGNPSPVSDTSPSSTLSLLFVHCIFHRVVNTSSCNVRNLSLVDRFRTVSG